MVVYLVDASPKMFTPATTQDDEKQETHFHTIVNCITESLKTQIIGRSYDEVAMCFFNTVSSLSNQSLALFMNFADYGENYDQEEAEAAAVGKASRGDASKKRKEITDAAVQISGAYDWAELADNGKLKEMTGGIEILPDRAWPPGFW